MLDDITLKVATCTRNESAKLGDDTYTKSNARTIAGWTSIRMTRGIERCPSDFEVSYTEPYPGTNDILVQEGDWVEVKLGDDKVMTGYVDRCTISITSREHSLRINGRSKCQDLVDCSSYLDGGQLLNMTVDKIAAVLCAPFGISVSVAAGTDVGDPIEQVNVMVGETPYSVLELLCRYRALLLYDTPDGNLLLASGGDAKTSGPIAIGARVASSGFTEGINVESATFVRSINGRYSRYDATYMGLDTLRDIGDGGNIIVHKSDDTVPRFRYRAIVSEHVTGGPIIAADRVNWELAYRYGRSYPIRLITDSWRDSAGSLYEPNVLVDVDLPSMKLPKKRWLISEVTYTRDAQGTHAELLIMPPQAFYQEPIILNPVFPDATKVTQ
ncbi:bacteriophage Mu P family protein [Burkholderia aenigmatica]|uniref:phage baseplate assembly protein n=1 Tax=Burkholderia cepacia complex TaxID=87882 RepID=UPI000F08F041|nr:MULTISPECIES: Mu P family protein [Burkholderia cepacia complex]AYQ37625.1 Mu P family protein [Burkholderia lata]VWC97964.1 bacteriophage Mu P family protein [Burkholderia aenigmatica]